MFTQREQKLREQEAESPLGGKLGALYARVSSIEEQLARTGKVLSALEKGGLVKEGREEQSGGE